MYFFLHISNYFVSFHDTDYTGYVRRYRVIERVQWDRLRATGLYVQVAAIILILIKERESERERERDRKKENT